MGPRRASPLRQRVFRNLEPYPKLVRLWRWGPRPGMVRLAEHSTLSLFGLISTIAIEQQEIPPFQKGVQETQPMFRIFLDAATFSP
jgi:hypothetical protein